jgi:hypothetical protein
MNTLPNWPSREQWASSRRYWDCETGCPFADRFSHLLSSYATSQEISAAVAALERLWRQYGRKMRELKTARPDLYEQPGETRSNYYARWRGMSEADRDLASEPDNLKAYRKAIKQAVARLRDDRLPSVPWELDTEARKLIAPFEARIEAARKAAEEEWEKEMAATEDAAWEKELAWRCEYERQ